MVLASPRPESAPPVSQQQPDLSLRLSDPYLARLIEQRAGAFGVVHLQHVTIGSLPPSHIVLHAEAVIGPLSTPITLQMQPQADGGQVRVDVTAAQLGPVAVPQALTGFVADAVTRSVQHLLAGKANVTQVRVLPGAVEVQTQAQ